MDQIAEHDVVAVAQGVVGRVDDAIGPGQRAARAAAEVGDGPADGHTGRIGNDLAGRRDGGHRQIGKTVAGHGNRQTVAVVGLPGRRLGIGVVAVGHDDQAPGAFGADRQRECQFAGQTRARSQAVDVALAEQQVGRIDDTVARKVDRFAHVGRVVAAVVAGLPAQGDGLAALQRAGGAELADDQIGGDDADHQAGAVVGFVGFADRVGRVGQHLQAPLARRQSRHRQAEALRQAGAGSQTAECRAAGQHLRWPQAQHIDQTHGFAERAVGRVVAGVAQAVVQRHGLADAPACRRSQAVDL